MLDASFPIRDGNPQPRESVPSTHGTSRMIPAERFRICANACAIANQKAWAGAEAMIEAPGLAAGPDPRRQMTRPPDGGRVKLPSRCDVLRTGDGERPPKPQGQNRAA